MLRFTKECYTGTVTLLAHAPTLTLTLASVHTCLCDIGTSCGKSIHNEVFRCFTSTSYNHRKMHESFLIPITSFQVPIRASRKTV